MIWFDFLNEKGYFTPESNPAPIIEKGGAKIPYWDSLTYLERLSEQIKEGKYLEYADKIINIILNVSKEPKDNYRTWYSFITILMNLPNDKVSPDVLNYIPTWLKSEYDTTLQTSSIGEGLLPKFLTNNPTPEDVSKAECILIHLLTLYEFPVEKINNDFGNDNSGYYLRTNPYFLKTSLIDKELVPYIVAVCSDRVILFIARNLKRILLSSPNIFGRLKSEPEDYLLRLVISNDDLRIFSQKGNNIPLEKLKIKDYEQLDTAALLQEIREAISKDNVTDIDEEELKKIVEHLNIDFNSLYLRDDIANLDDKINYDNDLQYLYAYILRQLLREKAKQDPAGVIKLCKKLAYDKKYHIPYFRRLWLDAIAVNPISEMRHAFWKMVDVGDEKYFNDDMFEAEVLRVLKAHASGFTESEIVRLNEVLKSKDSRGNDKAVAHWKFRIVSALKANDAFVTAYHELSSKLGITSDDLENFGNVAIPYEFDSPYTALELQVMPTHEIVEAIAMFRPEGNSRGPSIEGFGKTLGEVIKESPEQFSKELQLFDQLPYVYVYHILEGFREAWKDGKLIPWGELLMFCNQYISKPEFGSDKLKLAHDRWSLDHQSIIGTMGYLITDGTRSDLRAFDSAYLPVAKEIIEMLIPKLISGNRFKDSKMDFITYVINSSSGKMLRALLDYSLRSSRVASENPSVGFWDPQMKALFESSLDQKIPDSFILTGMYYQQIYYLDDKWMSNTFKAFLDLEDKLWRGFMSGLFFANAPFNKSVYAVAVSHYKRAIADEVLNDKTLYESNLATHIGIFYLRGYDDLLTENVITDFLIRSHPFHIDKFIGFLRLQADHLKKLEKVEWLHYASLVIDLWEYLIVKYERNDQEEYKRMLSDLSGLVGYIDKLNEHTAVLLVKSLKFTDRNFYFNQILDALIVLKDIGDSQKNAIYIGQILNAFNLNMYLPTAQGQILTLIEFSYLHGSKQLADKFCHKLGVHGYIFQNDLFQKYNAFEELL